jgi:autotransporter-associated beta strand protein
VIGFGGGNLVFKNSATAGSADAFTNNGGRIIFQDTSSAGNGTFTNNRSGSTTLFVANSTAGNGTFINNASGTGAPGSTQFAENSSADNGTFINEGGTFNPYNGFTRFSDNSTAANGMFVNNGGTFENAFGGATFFSGVFTGTPTAGNGIFINNGGTALGAHGGFTRFFGGSAGNGTFVNNGGALSGADGGFCDLYYVTAADGTFTNNGAAAAGAGAGFTRVGFTTIGSATFTNDGGTVTDAPGGYTLFSFGARVDSATLIANGGTSGGEGGSILFAGDSTGGTSRVEVFGNGFLDISSHLRARPLTIGSLQGDGDVFLGAGRLEVGGNDLSTTFSGVIQDGGENGGDGGSLTKTGHGTFILAGANTYTGDTNIQGGVLQVDDSIRSNTFVRRTRATLAGTGTINANVTNIRGTVSPGDAAPGVLTVVHNYTQAQYATLMIQIAGMSPDQFSVLDVMGNANLSGFLDPVLLNGFVPTIGQTFTFLNYASLTGEFSHIKDRVFDNGMLQWSVIYEANHAILTVEAHTPIPDQGSTFLLLALGLLGLVTFRRRLLRGQL